MAASVHIPPCPAGPFEGVKDLLVFSVPRSGSRTCLRLVNDLGLLWNAGHYLLGKGGVDDVPGQVFHGLPDRFRSGGYGKAVHSEEVAWDPYFQKDPEYHFDGINDSLKRAAEKMPRVDAIGGSAAGVYVNTRRNSCQEKHPFLSLAVRQQDPDTQ